MPALFLNLLKLIFLALIYLFLWQVARSIRAHVGPASSPRAAKTATEVVLVRAESASGQRFSLASPAVVGRSADADIVIDDPYASEFHLRLGTQDGNIVLHDLGSTNGTYLNGRRVTTPTTLSKGDSIQVGRTILEVR